MAPLRVTGSTAACTTFHEPPVVRVAAVASCNAASGAWVAWQWLGATGPVWCLVSHPMPSLVVHTGLALPTSSDILHRPLVTARVALHLMLCKLQCFPQELP